MRVWQARPGAGFDVGRDVATDTDGQQLVGKDVGDVAREVGKRQTARAVCAFPRSVVRILRRPEDNVKYMNRNNYLYIRTCDRTVMEATGRVVCTMAACGPARNV
jgi:hypothetical protein